MSKGALTRRAALRLGTAVGGTLLLPGCDEAPASVPAPWHGPRPDLGDPRLEALSWALLAPSPLNSQPWLARLADQDALELWADPDRRLPVADPRGRQTLIAHGALLELLSLAAAASGRSAEIELPPQAGDRTPVARVRLGAGASVVPDPLLAALPLRRSSRLAFDPEKPIEEPHAAALHMATAGSTARLGLAVEPAAVAALRGLCREAFALAYARTPALAERAAWTRLGAEEIAARPDGLTLTGRSVRWTTRLGLLSRRSLSTPGSLAWRVGLLQWDNLFAGTASFGWLVTAGDHPTARIAAGRAYQRVDLACAAQGVAIHPVSEALGDLAGTDGLHDRLRELAGVPSGQRIQMLFRLGYAGPVPATPRRPLAQIVRS